MSSCAFKHCKIFLPISDLKGLYSECSVNFVLNIPSKLRSAWNCRIFTLLLTFFENTNFSLLQRIFCDLLTWKYKIWNTKAEAKYVLVFVVASQPCPKCMERSAVLKITALYCTGQKEVEVISVQPRLHLLDEYAEICLRYVKAVQETESGEQKSRFCQILIKSSA